MKLILASVLVLVSIGLANAQVKPPTESVMDRFLRYVKIDTQSAEDQTTTPSWDLFQIPKPFTRARVYVASPIYVPADADEATLAAKRNELQQTLDDLNHQSEEWRRSLIKSV